MITKIAIITGILLIIDSTYNTAIIKKLVIALGILLITDCIFDTTIITPVFNYVLAHR